MSKVAATAAAAVDFLMMKFDLWSLDGVSSAEEGGGGGGGGRYRRRQLSRVDQTAPPPPAVISGDWRENSNAPLLVQPPPVSHGGHSELPVTGRAPVVATHPIKSQQACNVSNDLKNN